MDYKQPELMKHGGWMMVNQRAFLDGLKTSLGDAQTASIARRFFTLAFLNLLGGHSYKRTSCLTFLVHPNFVPAPNPNRQSIQAGST